MAGRRRINSMEIKIISNGTPQGTKVIDKATGEKIKNIRSITYTVAADKLAIAKVEFIGVEAELECGLVDATGLGQKYRTYKKAERA